MPYNTPKPKKIKGQVATYKGELNEIKKFYNNFPDKIKASNIFPEMSAGSSTGLYTIIVFYDAEIIEEENEDAI